MANAIITPSQLVTTCYLSPTTITEKQQKALIVYAKALAFKTIGGTDYTTSLSTTLLSTAATLCCGMEQPNRDAARVKLWFDMAMELGANVPAGISSKMNAITCLVEADPKALDEADLLLTYALTQGIA